MDVCKQHEVTEYKVDEMRAEMAEIKLELKEMRSDIRGLLEFKWKSTGIAIFLGSVSGILAKFIGK